MSLFELCVISLLENDDIISVPDHLNDYVDKCKRKALLKSVVYCKPLLKKYLYEKIKEDHYMADIYMCCDALKKHIDGIEYLKNEGKELFPKLTEGYGCMSSFKYIMLITNNKANVDVFVVLNTKNHDIENMTEEIRDQIMLENLLLLEFMFTETKFT
jgi:hypothetical protein